MRPRSAVLDSVRGKALSYLGSGLALAGVGAATTAACLSATPLGAARLDGAAPVIPVQRTQQVRAVGLDHSGGDLNRSVRVTRRSNHDRAAQRQTWAGVRLIVMKQAAGVSAAAA